MTRPFADELTLPDGPPTELSIDSIAEGLAIAMAEDWHAGRRRPVEEVLAEHPEIRDQPRAAVRLIYEEICLRQEENPAPLSVEMLGRFPGYREELQALLASLRLFEAGSIPPEFPEVGGTLGDARLLAELGQGALGRVFLATQAALADRPIVLKVIPSRGNEHLTLARLQHTNIVPLYASPVFPELGLRALFMPYLGSLTLARLASALREIPLASRSGADILAALDRSREEQPIDLPVGGSARAWLAKASYAQAVAWIGACLARALHHAHERGLVHLDLKPSNVLIASDGQPMLLDFHLARGPIRPDDPAFGMIGGTPTYMSPEQADALARVARGEPPRAAVDARSDLYSLGLILFELLGGTLPPPPLARDAARQLRQVNRQVSPSLAALVAKTMDADPAGRYPNASALDEDLHRYLIELPLRRVAVRDPAERWKRWRRRRPHALSLMVMVVAVGVTSILAVALARGPVSIVRRLDRADQKEAGRARRAIEAEDLAIGLAKLRAWAGTPAKPDDVDGLRELATVCHGLWESREKLLDDSAGPLSDGTERRIRADLRELAILLIALDDRARPDDLVANHRDALHRLDEAESRLGSSPELMQARDHLLAMPGPTASR